MDSLKREIFLKRIVKAIKTVNNPIRDAKNILVMNLGGIGDVLLSVPALKVLRNYYPKVHIALLIVPKTKEVVENLPCIDEIITFDIRTEEWRGIEIFLKPKQLKMVYRNIRALHKKKFDMIINLRAIRSKISAIKTALLFYGIGAKYRVGRDTAGGGFFLTHKMPEEWVGQMHEVDYNLNLVKMLGANTNERSIEFKVDNKDVAYIADFLRINGVSENDLIIGINPSAAWPSKCWPIENWVVVVKDLLEKLHPKIIITGSPDEIETSERLFRLSNSERIVLSTAKTTLKQLACLIKRCNLYITNDAGPMHIASLVHIPLIAIFGPGDFIRYHPLGDEDRIIILRKELGCSPCKRVKCNSLKCLKLISPTEVLDAAYFLIERYGSIPINKEG
jgi:ADP-heptose:LPS heptosyltransferase